MKNFLLPACGVLLVMAACTSKGSMETVSDYNIDLANVAPEQMSTLVDTVIFMPVVENNGQLPRDVNKLRTYNGKIYFSDYKYGSEKIFVYNDDGTPCFVIDAKGPGPNEYSGISTFTVNENGIAIIDRFQPKFILFDPETGEYIKSMQMPFQPKDIEAVGESDYLFSFTPSPDWWSGPVTDNGKHRIYRTDSVLNITKSYLALGDTTDVMGMRYEFARNNDALTYATVSKDGFYEYDAELDSMKFHRINFEHGLEGKFDVEAENVGDYQHIANAPVIVGDKVYIQFFSDKNNDGIYLYDTSTGLLYPNGGGDTQGWVNSRIVGAKDDYLISYIDDPDFYDWMVSKGMPKASDETEEFLSNDGGLLMFFKIRQGKE